MLHVTNGDCAAAALSAAGIDRADILPWRDVLHEGPVPGGMALERLSDVRAGFLCATGCGDYAVLRESFSERDFRIAGGQAEDEVVLWFESDLYDQLQLLQVLDWFADTTHRPARLTRIYTDRSPEDGRFEALGMVSPSRAHALLATRVPVSERELAAAVRVWASFRGDDPGVLADCLHYEDIDALPHLRDAIVRLFEELPDSAHGLSRTELNAARLLAEQAQRREALFKRVQGLEARPWLGDVWFWRMLDRLAAGETPLLERRPNPADPAFGAGDLWSVTGAGRAVLEGEADAIALSGVDRWLGGTRVWHGGTVWRWNGASVLRQGARHV